MRILLKTSPSDTLIPFEYQEKLVGCLHKWIGHDNDLHGKMSLYSFSWLQDSSSSKEGLTFPHGSRLFISFYDEAIVKKVIRSILNDPEMFYGLRVEEVLLVKTPDFTNREVFQCASPIFIKRTDENGKEHQYNYNDVKSGEYLKETLLSKMKLAGMVQNTDFSIQFDDSYSKKKLKLVHYRGIGNKASLCPVIIHGSPEVKEFAWNVGLGNCTGIGFGSLY
jgi:CRISPR-associated endoribonuclease Cas6